MTANSAVPCSAMTGVWNVASAAVTGGTAEHVHLKLWHGVTPALIMSIVATLGGAFLLWLHRPLDRVWLSTPRPEFGFAGLKPGDRWCLCAGRFAQAHDEGCAPRVHLAATHARALEIVPIEVLKAQAE